MVRFMSPQTTMPTGAVFQHFRVSVLFGCDIGQNLPVAHHDERPVPSLSMALGAAMAARSSVSTCSADTSSSVYLRILRPGQDCFHCVHPKHASFSLFFHYIEFIPKLQDARRRGKVKIR